jgi:hypothetical protein
MNKSYMSRISEYCIANRIYIPAGFKGGAQRYAAIDLSANPPKLVAATWFKHADVIYFIRHFGNGREFRLLDFKEKVELHLEDDSRLRRGHAF